MYFYVGVFQFWNCLPSSLLDVNTLGLQSDIAAHIRLYVE